MRTRTSMGRYVVVLSGLVALAACQDSDLAPMEPGQERVRLDIGGNCGNEMAASALPASDPPRLTGVVVTATFPGFATGLPWNVIQQMQFPLQAGAHQAPCMNSDVETYVSETLYVADADPIPRPDGVSEEFWASLSEREKRALLERAELWLRIHPNANKSVGIVISEIFEQPILRAKALAKRRATDFLGASQATELMAGGVYGCLLYREFKDDYSWFLSNQETLQLVADLVTGFGEAEFRYDALRGARFIRNGVFGAGRAFNDTERTDCGQMIFNSIHTGAIDVRDPRASREPSPTPPGSGGYVPLPPENGLPPGWMDQ
jgi:hypothetical protein